MHHAYQTCLHIALWPSVGGKTQTQHESTVGVRLIKYSEGV